MNMFRANAASRLILYPQMADAWDHLTNLHHEYKQTGKATNSQVLGVSGLGKTTLLRSFEAIHPQREDEFGMQLPVVRFAMPSAPTPKSVMGAILGALGGPNVGTASTLMDRAVHYLEHFRVEVLLADETHHLIDRGRMRTHAHLGDLWKEFNDRVKCCLVLAGAPRLVQLFDTNNQLRNRAGVNLVLRPFGYESFEGPLHQFVLAAISGSPLQAHQDFLTTSETLIRIQYATDGVHAQIVRYLEGLSIEAANSKELDFSILDRAWKVLGSAGFPSKRRPFHRDFNFERLCGSGEPFYPSPFDGDNHAPYY